MPIEFRCQSCQKLLRVPDGSAGKKAKCPDCAAVLTIPESSPTPAPSPPQPSAPTPPQQTPSHQAPPEQAAYSAPPPMSENPFESPHTEHSQAHLTDAQVAAKVSPPAICLMVSGGIGVAVQVLSLGIVLMMGAGGLGGDFPADDGIPGLEFTASFAWNVGSSLLCMIRSVVLIFAAIQMKNLRSYPFALTMSIFAIVPCFSGCCLLDMPFGIWATVILCQADVKAAFSRAAGGF